MEATIGKYRIVGELGRGGMATVYLAVRQGPAGSGFNKLQVLKVLKPNLSEDPSFLAMFLDEARLAARVNHPNVVQTNEIGQAGKLSYIAMEYLDGQPLHRIISRARKGRGLPLRMHLMILADAVAGLHHAHELADYDGTPLSIVHRDVSPHNLFVTYDGFVKVVDFGIAKAARRTVETQKGIIKGKIAYMAPEQVLGGAIDRRADLFAVGVMLWEAAVGHRLWSKVEDIEVMKRLLAGNVPRSPKALNPTVPDELDAICQRALAHDPADRYANGPELQRDLEKLLQRMGGRPAPDELATLLKEMFADKRTEVKRLIEERLAAAASEPFGGDTGMTDSGPASVPSFSSGGTNGAISSSGSGTGSMSGGSSTPRVATSSIARAGPKPPSRSSSSIVAERPRASSRRSSRKPKFYQTDMFRVPAFMAVGLVVFGLARWSTSRGDHDASPGPRPPASGKDHVEEIELTLRATPAQALFSIDNGPPLPNPYVGRFARDGAEHMVSIRADGYKSVDRPITFAANILIEEALERETIVPSSGQASVPIVSRGGTSSATGNRTGASTSATPTDTTPAPSAEASTTSHGERVRRPIDQKNPFGGP